MTVAELLERLAKAFPAFNTRALEAWAPVFSARFKHREGPHLASALTECMASFDPKAKNKLFPTPPDIEAHMPALKSASSSDDGGPIRALLEARHARSIRLFDAWMQGQGRKIKAARPQAVYNACVLEMKERSMRAGERTASLLFSAEDISDCEHRAASTERVRKFGRVPAKTEEWESQMAQVRAEWESSTKTQQQEAA